MKKIAPGTFAGRTMAAAVVDLVIVAAIGPKTPSGADWTILLALVKQQGVDKTSHLFASAGGQPSPLQRRELADAVADHIVPTAIVSDVARIRHGVTLVSWGSQACRAFKGSEIDNALAFLRAPSPAFVRAKLDELRRYLGEAP